MFSVLSDCFDNGNASLAFGVIAVRSPPSASLWPTVPFSAGLSSAELVWAGLVSAGLLSAGLLVTIEFRLHQRITIWIARFIFWWRYRIRVLGDESLPKTGPALIVSNHISWLDGIVIQMMGRRPMRTIVFVGNFQNRLLRAWATNWGAIMIDTGPKSIVKALVAAREALNKGQVVFMFPEGGISRSGQLRAFRPGIMKILKGTSAPVIPVYLDGLWGSIFSYSGGRFFWKKPRLRRRTISLHYGQPLYSVSGVHEIRQAVLELGATAVNQRRHPFMSLPQNMVRQCKKRVFRSKLADSSGMDATGGVALLRALILRRLLKRHVLQPDEQNIGLLLPPSVGGVLANMALALDRRVGINLNYTVTSDVMNQCIRTAGIKHVLTSRQVMSKLDLQLDVDVVYLDDFKSKVTLMDKLVGGLAAYTMPGPLLSSLLGLGRIRGDELATIIFTSGSTGTPKGVELTYDNIASNVEAIDQVIHLRPDDVVVGILPFFHSFGYTVTMWTPLALDAKCVYHYSPIDGKRIGKLAAQHRATILLSTPTFLRNYLKRCKPEQFATLDVVVAGAEKLPSSLCDAFEQKFGVRPVEGYGCTELSPLASVNVPPSRQADATQTEAKEGTVGRTVPNVAAKIVHLETGEDLGPGKEGMLMIQGPNVMRGYLNMPEKTAEVVRDGWYQTGDVALVDEDGFIKITGRDSRFSKIGGEMVPHILIEETLERLIGGDEEEGLKAAVTAVPDERKGERLIVLHTKIDKTADELRDGLLAEGLPNLFIPSAESFLEVAELPVLGTGKLDLSGMKQMALKITSS